VLRLLLPILILCAHTAAAAEWLEATSKHFIIYSKGSPEKLRETVANLEKYDFMLRAVSNLGPQKQDPPKIKIYMMRNAAEVGATMSPPVPGVAGYYTSSPRGTMAVSTRAATGGDQGLRAQEVLFHELAHHFMYQYFPATYPSWYSEGFADYYGTARILEKDVIEVGHAVQNRYLSFADNSWLPLEKLLTAKSYADVAGNLDLLYAEGWLLVHYLGSAKARQGQLQKYLQMINAGMPYEKARDEAFGPGAKQLNSELQAYATKRQIMAIRLPFKPIDVGPITIREMSPAENALLLHDIALGRGVLQREAGKFAAEVRSDSASYQDDPYALRILTEAERAAGGNEAAARAVDRWLAVQPQAPLALMHKAELQIDGLRKAGKYQGPVWEDARKLILAAAKGAPRNPQILVSYYDSFVAQGMLPPAGAQNALVRAFELVPQDSQLRHKVAADFESRNMIEDAIATIKPAALVLHGAPDDPKKAKKQAEARERDREVGDSRSETAREMLERLEKKLAGQSR
jgi:hypothetical protein